MGDVLADLAVAARGPPLEDPVAVDQRDGEPIDLRLADETEVGILDPLARKMRAHPRDPGAQLLLRADVGQREHRLEVHDLLQAVDRRTARPLRLRIGRDELGMGRLELDKLAVEGVVGVITDLRVVLDVVALRVVGELRTQLRQRGPPDQPGRSRRQQASEVEPAKSFDPGAVGEVEMQRRHRNGPAGDRVEVAARLVLTQPGAVP